jgi:uncharacterized protein YqeY
MADDSNNLADTAADGTEINPPAVLKEGDAPQPGQPTLPGLSRGSMKNTTIDQMNNSLAHVCDFATELQKNNKLKLWLKAQAATIREAIRKVLTALGFSDVTGQSSWATETLKAITRELKKFNKEVLKPIMDFEKIVIEYIAKLKKIIAWILSLPAKLAALLSDCIKKLTMLIASTFSDLGGDGAPSELSTSTKELIAAAKETTATTLKTINTAVKTAATAAAVVVPIIKLMKKSAP